MAIRLGADAPGTNDLPNPVDDGYIKRPDVRHERWTMANNNEVMHLPGSGVRWIFEIEWRLADADTTNLIAALNAAITAEKTFKPPDEVTTYQVYVDPSSYTIEELEGAGGKAKRIRATLRSTTSV